MYQTDVMSVGTVPRLPGGLADELDRQSARCRPTSELYAVLLSRLAEDARAGGLTASLLAPYADDPVGYVPGLKLMAAVHAIVLDGRAPELAAFYPSMGGAEPPEDAWPALRRVLAEHTDEIRLRSAEPVQTNEPGRSAVLFGGLLAIAGAVDLPIRLLEVGASAGLNLRADRFAYRVNGRLLGDPRSPLVLDEPWEGAPDAPEGTAVTVIERRGCDVRPIDPVTSEGRLRLLSLIWADAARADRARRAMEVAAAVPATVDAASGPDWLATQLATPVPGAVTVVWHSVVRQYVDPPDWRRVGVILAEAGAAATSSAPLAHLAFEPDIAQDGTYTFPVRLTLWPGGARSTLGAAAPHGIPTRWTKQES
jgi:hypothetical protein